MINNAEFKMLTPTAQFELLDSYFDIEINWSPYSPGRLGAGEVTIENIPLIWCHPNIEISNNLSKYIAKNYEDSYDWLLPEELVESFLLVHAVDFLVKCFSKGYISFDEKKHWFKLEPHFTMGCVFHI